MTRPHRFLLITISTATMSACASTLEEELRQRVARVENGMIPAVVARGQANTPISVFEIMRLFDVPGVSIAVINNGAIEWAEGYGVVEAGGPSVNTETLFLAGHMSQVVAAVSALTLVDEGRIDLDSDVNSSLESWQVPENQFTNSMDVTVRQLLTHTSGLSMNRSLGYLQRQPLPTLQQILDGNEPATNEPVRVTMVPGSGSQYSLGGYVVLEQILEDISGQSYAEFAHSLVLSSVGMGRSVFQLSPTDESTDNAATGHESTNEPVEGRWRTYPEHAALGLWSTPSDLARLVIELQRACAGDSGRILSPQMARELLTEQVEGRGLAVELGGEGDWRFFRIEGHGVNYLTDLFAYVSQGKGAVVMTNSSNGEAVRAHVLRAIAVEYGWPDLLPEEVDVASMTLDALSALTGTYSFRGRERVLRVENGRLLQSSDGSPDQEILPLADSLLVSSTFGYRYGVEKNDAGNVVGLTLILNGARLFTYEKN